MNEEKPEIMIHRFSIPFLMVVLWSSMQLATAQPPKLYVDDVYFNQAFFLEDFDKDANAIIGSGNFLSPEQARIQLELATEKTVSIDVIKPENKILSSSEIADKVKESTVLFGAAYNCGNCHKTHMNVASGYVIDAEGVCVTNYHVVESYVKGKDQNLSLQIRTADGQTYPVIEILAASSASDLAIVKVETKGDRLKPLALGDPAESGDKVYVMSHPNRMLYYFSTGVVARNYVSSVSNQGTDALPQVEMEITADYAAGSSGAPVVDNKGNLVSTVSTTRSIYYHPGKKEDLQMVVKGTKPVILLQRLLK